MNSARVAGYVTPNFKATEKENILLAVLWTGLLLIVWQFFSTQYLPTPTALVSAMGDLLSNGSWEDFIPSLWLMAQAIFYTTLISLTLSYLSVIPAFRPIPRFISGLRYFGLVGLSLLFTLATPNSYVLKITLLTFGMTVFYLKDMVTAVERIPLEDYEHAQTLGLNPFEVVYNVVVRGTLATAIESLRNNAAIAWVMLPMVEGIARADGGVGILLQNMGRRNDLGAIGSVLVCIYILGKLQDAGFWALKTKLLCPYTDRKN